MDLKETVSGINGFYRPLEAGFPARDFFLLAAPLQRWYLLINHAV